MNERGLTLVELLIAMTIFAFVSAASVASFNLAASGASQLQEATDRLAKIERMRSIMRGDLALFADLPVYEPNSSERRPAFVGGTLIDDVMPDAGDGEWLLALVRSGWTNVASVEPRSELQAVGYLLIDDALVRRTRPFIDAANETPHRDQVLLTNLDEIELAYYYQGDWDDDLELGAVPTALRLMFVHPAYGRMRHDFLVWGGQ
ncbi:MAG: type II secretion system minor pseudopilin GspJ [Pseudomonadota bacterium]